MYRDVYSGRLKLLGKEHSDTIRAAHNYANSLLCLKRFEEARSVLRKMMPVARRVLGESRELTLLMRWNYAQSLRKSAGATLDDVREAVATLEDTTRIMRQVLGGAHPTAKNILLALGEARATLRARETPSART